MNCSNPQVIPAPGLYGRPSQHIPGMARPYRFDTLVVPCGKCMACVEKRQKDFAFRIRAEAEKRGSMVFLTLTYANEHLPLVQTLWRVDKSTGEAERVTDPEFVCYSGREDFLNDRKDMAQVHPSARPRYIDHAVFEDDEFSYFSRITPSVCRKDVQNWLKRCRVHFERHLGRFLDFSYSICSEYGSKYCRPHYHCCLMGVSESDAQIMASLWKYGFYKLDFVYHVNKDGSDGFSKVSNYVAKYIAKGEFECRSVKDCTALPCRQMNSKGLGSLIEEKFKPYMLCYDLVGAAYNPDNFWCEDKKRYLSRSEIVSLVAEVPKRLAVNYDGKTFYGVPRLFRQKVFYVEKTRFSLISNQEVKYRRPSKLWRMVVDSIQKQYADLDQRQFKQLLSDKSPGEIAKAVSLFNVESQVFAKASDEVRKENYKTRLQSSLF